MQPDAWLQILLRALPAVIVLVLGFVAATDKKTRLQWNNVLYQIGSIRPDQREDLQLGRGVKWPFFVVALFLLIWPIQYYRLATRTFEVKSDIYSESRRKNPSLYDKKAETTNAATSQATPEAATNYPEVAPPPETAPSPASTGSSNRSGGSRSLYGQPR